MTYPNGGVPRWTDGTGNEWEWRGTPTGGQWVPVAVAAGLPYSPPPAPAFRNPTLDRLNSFLAGRMGLAGGRGPGNGSVAQAPHYGPGAGPRGVTVSRHRWWWHVGMALSGCVWPPQWLKWAGRTVKARSQFSSYGPTR